MYYIKSIERCIHELKTISYKNTSKNIKFTGNLFNEIAYLFLINLI